MEVQQTIQIHDLLRIIPLISAHHLVGNERATCNTRFSALPSLNVSGSSLSDAGGLTRSQRTLGLLDALIKSNGSDLAHSFLRRLQCE